jgi:ABC-type multidrug transport system permease subunit
VIVLVVMSLTGLLVGWRIHTTFWEAAAGFGLLLLFAYAMSWGMAIVGLAIRSPDVFNQASFMVIFPLTFVANTFVPTNNMPGALKAVAEWNPVSALTQAVRELFGNTSSAIASPEAWPLRHSMVVSFGWIVLMVAIFVPLAVNRYKRAVGR